MSLTISNTKDSLTGMIHSTNLDKIKNINDLFRRAANKLLAEVDPPDTIKIAQITNAVHSDIYDYSAPSDLKGNMIIDIRPQVNRALSDRMGQRFIEPFDLRKRNNTFNVLYNSGEKSLRLSKNISPAGITLHDLNSITANGTWAVGGDATNLTADSLNVISGSASLNFDLDGSGTTGYIEISDMTDVDLSDQDEIGQIFVRVYIPDSSTVTNFILRWGNDTSNYWHSTVTAPHDQTTFKTGWNILRFNWNGATEVGTVDPEAIDYLRVTVTYDGDADTDYRVDKISCSSGEIWEVVYYSEFLFRTSGGTWQETTGTDTDIINLDVDGYNLFLYECAILAAQQAQTDQMTEDINFFKRELYGYGKEPGLYSIYKTKNPNQVKKPIDFYYRIR